MMEFIKLLLDQRGFWRIWHRGTNSPSTSSPAHSASILLEDGSYLLLEDGSNVLLE